MITSKMLSKVQISRARSKAAREQRDDPFGTFSEWSSEADRRAFDALSRQDALPQTSKPGRIKPAQQTVEKPRPACKIVVSAKVGTQDE